jgi:D-amino-acid dehydrogenase
MTKQIAVIGAGITGITTAYYLAREGYKVTVFEQEPHPAMRTSFANGGQVSVSNSEVWNTWSNVKKGIGWMFTKDAPLLIRPRLDWAQWRWMAKFLYNTAQGVYKKNTAKTIRMGLAARALYEEIQQEENIKFDASKCGILHYYKNEQYFEAAKQAKKIYNDNGLDWNILSTTQAYSMDPALSNVPVMIGAAWTKTDWTGDIHKFCYELAEVLKTKYGVQFCYNWQIKHVEEMSFHDAVVVANGVGSTALAKTAGDSIDVYPVKGYSITINNVDPKYLPRVSLLDDQAKIVTSTLGNRFRVAGTAELAGENYDIRQDRIKPLLDWVHTNFPKINTHDYTSWACLRPMTPDMMPIVKQSDNKAKVFYNTGHGHLGWTLAPYTAKSVTDLIKKIIC